MNIDVEYYELDKVKLQNSGHCQEYLYRLKTSLIDGEKNLQRIKDFDSVKTILSLCENHVLKNQMKYALLLYHQLCFIIS